MEALYYGIALITAGISIAMGTITLGIGLSPMGNKSFMYFGAMCLLMAGFIFSPPVGFIVTDPAPYSGLILFKRIFIFGYYTAFPWFIYHYTAQTRKIYPWTISLFVLLSYFVMFSEDFKEEPPPLWTHFALGIFASTLAYGILGTWSMHRSNRKAEAFWLALAMGVYFVLFIQSAQAQLSFIMDIPTIMGGQLHFPIHLHSLALILIVGIRLQRDAISKLMLERVVEAQRNRWSSFLTNTPVLIFEIERNGKILFVNEFAVARLGAESPDELVGKNWFHFFVSDQERQKASASIGSAKHPSTIAAIKDHFRFGNKAAILVNWLSFSGSSDTVPNGTVVLVGQDLTIEQNALFEVAKLKMEIEKEALPNLHHVVANISPEIIGTSKALGYTLQKVQQVAATNATVLLEGETGVGKELFADYIHAHSLRSEKPFIKINCSAMPADLIEDELFGHEKGAFTSASSARTGRFELADGGTILLDEIGEMPLSVQPKLLRVLQQGEFERVGGQKTIRVDVRIIAATNRDLNAEVAEGKFRSDLLYRLNVFPISIPALRNRKEDLDMLVSHFVDIQSALYRKQFRQISKSDLKRIHEYSWPGNIRELRNLIERSVIQSEGDTLKLQWLDHGIEPDSNTPTSMEEVERDHIIKILTECNWKINGANGAAERLEMNPNTLRSRMKKLNIVREQNVGS